MKDRLRDYQNEGQAPFPLMAEDHWMEDGYAYYNVHPQLVEKLCKANLEKIPSNLFQMPHGHECVNIRFSQQHQQFTLSGKISSNHTQVASGAYSKSLLMFHVKEESRVLLVVEFGNDFGGEALSTMYLHLESGKSLGDVLESCAKRSNICGSSHNNSGIGANLLGLAVTVGFLSNNPVICEYDVLSKDRSKYQNADEDQKEKLRQKAKRRGKVGYNIGNDLMFMGAQPKNSNRQHVTGRELEYAHIRRGHPHAVRYGKNKELVKIMWFSPTTVRDDLPFKA
jgi:hypothetical protein